MTTTSGALDRYVWSDSRQFMLVNSRMDCVCGMSSECSLDHKSIITACDCINTLDCCIFGVGGLLWQDWKSLTWTLVFMLELLMALLE